ncbi:hypothetical protein BP6252_11776 [Coleophoma cylindrospora]|uniref:Uncharacterized protein n=1 Tax=Coleophoma cylindrospora TaxID=1849047 RepID=A0A3D8QKI7_9HELO|nr:hypothetical protein BP6252_11776 [Coleophoma cylindrospora]
MFSIRTTVFIRLLTSLAAGGSLALWVLSLQRVLAPYFPSQKPGLTFLPIVFLSISIILNLLHLSFPPNNPTITRARKWLDITGDILIALLLTAVGIVAFVHDNYTYFRTGMWRQYNDNDSGFGWFNQEVIAGSLMILVVLLHILLAISQLFGCPASVFDARTPYDSYPPAYPSENSSVTLLKTQADEKKQKITDADSASLVPDGEFEEDALSLSSSSTAGFSLRKDSEVANISKGYKHNSGQFVREKGLEV